MIGSDSKNPIANPNLRKCAALARLRVLAVKYGVVTQNDWIHSNLNVVSNVTTTKEDTRTFDPPNSA